MADPARARRLGVRIREIVASALGTEVKDPRLGLVTITDVRVGADLRDATVFYTVYGDDLERAESAAALESAKGVLRTRVGRMTGVKNTPTLAFVHDELPDSARHLDDLLAAARADDDRIRAARATAAPAGDEDPYRHPGGRVSSSLEADPFAVPLLASTPIDVDHAGVLGVIKSAMAGDGWVLCVGHVQPDADALGSALALALAIERSGGTARVSFDPGPLAFGLPPSLDFLPGAHLLLDPKLLGRRPAPAAVITFDTGSAERLGLLAPYARTRQDGPPVIVIDHHARGVAFGSMRLVDAGAAATAELIAEMIDELGVAFDPAIATCLYAGLASDTGSFRYAATSPGSHRLAARLLEAGARHDTISMLLWDSRPASYLRVLAGALARVQHDGQVIWTYVTCADLRAAGATPEETEGIVDVIRGSREHEVAVVLKEDPAGGPLCWKASVRSRGHVDIGAACTELGGGGHRLAAGFSAEGTPQQIIARLQDALPSVS